MNFSVFRFGFKLTFKSVYVYHLVLLIYMVLAQDNTSLTNFRMLLLRGRGVLLSVFQSSTGVVRGVGKCCPKIISFSFISLLSGKVQRGFSSCLSAPPFLIRSASIWMESCFPGNKLSCKKQNRIKGNRVCCSVLCVSKWKSDFCVITLLYWGQVPVLPALHRGLKS